MGVMGLGGVEEVVPSLGRKGEEAYVLVLSFEGLGDGEFLRWSSIPTNLDAEGSCCRPRGELERETILGEAPSVSNRCDIDPKWGWFCRVAAVGVFLFESSDFGTEAGISEMALSISSPILKICLRSAT